MNYYYYLISSLPALFYDHHLVLPNHDETIKFIKDGIQNSDYQSFNYLQYPGDIKLIVNHLYTKSELPVPYPFVIELPSFHPFSLQEILNGDFPANYPFQSILEELKIESTNIDPLKIEMLLWNKFYHSMKELGDHFLVSWFQFDLRLRKAALQSNKRKFNVDELDDINGIDAEVDLSDIAVPQDNQLLHEGNTPVELEMILDKIRWNYVDRLSAFSFFSADSIFAWYLKYLILLRWSESFNQNEIEKNLQKMIESTLKTKNIEIK